MSSLSTAEAELNGATLGWQILEGLRLSLVAFGIILPTIAVMVDNQAALTIAKCGANWRTRYFAVRGHRLHEEHERGWEPVGGLEALEDEATACEGTGYVWRSRSRPRLETLSDPD